MNISRKLVENVEKELRCYFEKKRKTILTRVEILDSTDRPFSTIIFFRAHTSVHPFDLVLKKISHHPLNISITTQKNQAEVEYSVLKRLYPHFMDDKFCSVPEPIAVFPSDEAYLMENIRGVLLNEKLKSARYFSFHKDFNELIRLYHHCGRWLKKFQEVTATPPLPASIFSNTIERCEAKLDLILNANDPRVQKDIKKIVMGNIKHELQKIEQDDIQVAGRHGDFGGWNILANNNKITVFDFLGSQEDSVAIDVLKMLVNFEDEKNYLIYSRAKIEALKNSFLCGYGQLPKIQRPVAIICETLHRVCSLCASVVHIDGLGFRGKFEKKLNFNQHLQWLLTRKKKLLWPNFQ